MDLNLMTSTVKKLVGATTMNLMTSALEAMGMPCHSNKLKTT